MELHRDVAQEARPRRDAPAALERTLCALWTAAPRAGQVVSRRAAAALVAWRLLARRWRSALERRSSARRHDATGPYDVRERTRIRRKARARARHSRALRHHGVRRRPEAAGRGIGAAGERRSAAGQSRERRRARPARATPPGRSRAAGGIRAAVESDARRKRPDDPVGDEPMA